MTQDLFPHIGEILLEEIIRQDPTFLLDYLNLPKESFVNVHRQVSLLFPGIKISFDGFSTIDLGLQFDDGTIFPIEVKLGYKGLSRSVINNKHLRMCKISSHETNLRISGKILAVLNRKFDKSITNIINSCELHAQVNNEIFKVTKSWGAIAREKIITSWKNYPPNFSEIPRTVSVESICENYGKERFNLLVKELISSNDYYQKWIEN